MIVCSCHDVTEATICELVDNGHTKYYDIQTITKVGRTCGSCAPQVIDVIAKRRNDGGSV